MTPLIGGIDASITGTAVAVGNGTTAKIQRFASKKIGNTVSDRIKRLELVIAEVMPFLEAAPPAVIFLENYSFGSVNGGEYLGEFGGILRWHLLDITPHVFEVAPGTLKKFVTGRGDTKKEQMIAHVLQQWGEMFPTNDHADAFGLYRFGLCASGMAPMTNQAQRDSVAKVIGTELLSLSPPAMSA